MGSQADPWDTSCELRSCVCSLSPQGGLPHPSAPPQQAESLDVLLFPIMHISQNAVCLYTGLDCPQQLGPWTLTMLVVTLSLDGCPVTGLSEACTSGHEDPRVPHGLPSPLSMAIFHIPLGARQPCCGLGMVGLGPSNPGMGSWWKYLTH